MSIKKLIFTLLLLVFVISSACLEEKNNNVAQVSISNEKNISTEKDTLYIPKKIETRQIIKTKLKEKIKQNIPLVAHILVPLCDNEHQGIVPTSKSLGDGMSLKTNLYWATRHGMKRYFKDLSSWKLLKEEKDISSSVLERVIFEKKYPNNAKVFLIIDAYRGDKMQDCLNDFMNSMANKKAQQIEIDSNTNIQIYSNADLIGFNGHNGLMDTEINKVQLDTKKTPNDAVVIACASAEYFNPYFEKTETYPLVTTTNLLYPGAFVFEAIINNWAQMKDDELIRQSAGDAYHKAKNCGIRGARALFKTGW